MTLTTDPRPVHASPSDVRAILDNPDGCSLAELMAAATYIGDGVRPAHQAASIYTNRYLDSLDNYTGNRTQAVVQLRKYCVLKASAMLRRSAGRICEANDLEVKCDRIYDRLPFWAQW